MTNKISLKKNTIANYLGQFYTMFIGIFMLPFYLKYLGAEAYGLVGFFTMLQSIMMLLDMGLSSTLTRELAKNKQSLAGLLEFKKLLRSVEVVFIILSIIVFLIIFIFDDWIASQWLVIKTLTLEEVSYCISLVGLMIGIRWLTGLYRGCINGLEYQVWLNVYGMIFATLRFVGAYILIKYISNEVSHFFEYQVLLTFIEFYVITRKIYSYLPIESKLIKPSFVAIKKIAPFALSIAYVSGIWIVLTQMDKLLLSHFLPLNEYGYFALVVIVSNGIMLLSGPISQAILPRMTALFTQNREKEMILLYRKATQFVTIVSFAVSAVVAVYATELLYAWTGDQKASSWAGSVLFWYALGNGLLPLLAFQYYLQYAHGNLTHHVKGNTVFGFIQIGIMFFAIYYYGAIGAGIAWFTIQVFFFMVWTAYIHHIFTPGLHKKWILEDVAPVFISTTIVLLVFKFFKINFELFNRFEQFGILLLIGIVVLISNVLAASQSRKMILYWIKEAK